MENIWITDEGRQFNAKDMSIPHIVNIIKCWEGKGRKTIEEDYLGGKEKWITIFKEELKSRNSKS